LKSSHKRAINRVIDDILSSWTLSAMAPEILPVWLATPSSFYDNVFQKKLAIEVNQDLNDKKTDSDAITLNELLKVRYCHLV
jgi:hypothetical protein